MDLTVPVMNVVRAWETKDIDLMMDQLADDAAFENVPMNPLLGKEAIRAANGAFIQRYESSRWVILNIAVVEATRTVLSERIDIYMFADGRAVNVPCMGAWTVNEDNKITRWRDYFDLASFNKQMGRDLDAGRGDGGMESVMRDA